MQVSDNLYLGSAFDPVRQAQGVGPLARIHTYDVVPLASNTTNVAPLQGVTAGASMTLAAGAGTTYVQAITGVWRVYFDCPRVVTITSANNLSAAKFTVTGRDLYGQVLSQVLAGPNANTVATQKAFAHVSSVTCDTSVAAVSVGTGNALGLPVAAQNGGYVVHIGWSGVFGQDGGTLVTADTNAATVLTGDVRGTYTPSTAPDGTKRLLFTLALSAAQAGPAATRDSASGVGNSNLTSAQLSKNYIDGGDAFGNFGFLSYDGGASAQSFTQSVIGGTA